MRENAFFKRTDPTTKEVGGFPISPNWWSRIYEYPWAFQYAAPGQVVVDMGCGYTPRPFKDALAATCKGVYAVDGNIRILEFPKKAGLAYIVADFTERIDVIPENSLDRVFCISVLEDVGTKIPKALYQFGRLLQPGGLCVLTFDVQYDYEKPLGQYPGVNLVKFVQAVDLSGMVLREPLEIDRKHAVFNRDFNLAAYHCVLEKP